MKKLIPEPTVSQVASIRALIEGKATADQQKIGMAFIADGLAGRLDLPFQDGGEEGRRLTDFNCGRQFVGIWIGKMLEPATLNAAQERERRAKVQ